jgi:hypothetical protein
MTSASSAGAADNLDDEFKKWVGTASGGFDSDFGDSMSKPIPDWFKDSLKVFIPLAVGYPTSQICCILS